MVTNLITQGPSDINCVYVAISTLRAALGYDTSYPDGLDMPELVFIDFVVAHAQEFFPKHPVAIWGDVRLKKLSELWYGVKPSLGDCSPGHLWMFDYSTPEQWAHCQATETRWDTHTVLGVPSLHKGMWNVYAIRVGVEPL